MSEKIHIARDSSDPEREYGHLEPIVSALLDAGNRLVDDELFHLYKDGWRCDLEFPIDFELVREQFVLPTSILVSETNDSILCRNTWAEIKGSSKGRR